MPKLKLAFYWAASCGGCEISVLEIGEKILTVAEIADIVFWPAALDFKYADVEKMPDKTIDVCFFNGGIRTSEHRHIAELLRAKSKLLVAFGSCAMEGCIPGLANLHKREEIFNRVYHETPTTDNPGGIIPKTKVEAPEGTLELPEFLGRLSTLGQTVDVDYSIPGCPPVGDQVWAAIEAIVSGNLPPKGSVIGARDKTLCDECERKREGKKIKKIYRNYEIIPDREKCLLEQGILCMGPATRGGCGGALCVKANMPCRGCYGPPPGVRDQGAKMLSALASILEAESSDEMKEAVDKVVDPVGTFYMFGFANSLLKEAKK
ncbi:MAG: oxidoreductase [Candidatus Bathyarchaeia archaeon]